MGCSKTEMSEECQSIEMKTSTPMRNSSRSQSPLCAPAIEEGEGTLCTVENVDDNRLLSHRIIFFGSPSQHGFVFNGTVL